MKQWQGVTSLGRPAPAVIAVLVLIGMGWIAPAPAQAQVRPGSGIEFYYGPELDLGPAEVNGKYQLEAYLFNFEKFPIYVRVVGTSAPFETPEKDAAVILPAGYYATIHVTFAPKTVGPATGTLEVETNWLPSALVVLSLKGKGVDRDKLPDLSGVWNLEGNGSVRVTVTHGKNDRVAITMSESVPGANGVPYELVRFEGRFDGEWCVGRRWSFGAYSGYFLSLLKQPDLLLLDLYDDNLDLVFNGHESLTRRSPAAGTWGFYAEVAGADFPNLGNMTLAKITEKAARDLMTMFPNYFGKLNPPASASYYYGEYPWSGGGAMLFYSANTYDVDKPALKLIGRYGERLGTHSGSLQAQVGAIGVDPYAHLGGVYQPDGGNGYPYSFYAFRRN